LSPVAKLKLTAKDRKDRLKAAPKLAVKTLERLHEQHPTAECEVLPEAVECDAPADHHHDDAQIRDELSNRRHPPRPGRLTTIGAVVMADVLTIDTKDFEPLFIGDDPRSYPALHVL